MKVSLTREGRRFLLALLVVAFAAFNTANNLMYLILGLMLSATVLSLSAAFLTLRGIDVELAIEEPLYANLKAPVGFTIRNSKVHLSSYSLRIRLPGVDDEGIYIQKVLPGGDLRYNKYLLFPGRGRYSVSNLSVQTSFPFIFFVVSKTMQQKEGGTTFLVYPGIMDVTDEVERLLAEMRSGEGIMKAPEEEEFHGLRDYRYGDPLRSIHWKATARTGTFMVKEYHEGMSRRMTIVLDSLRYPDRETFERAISFAASLSAELIRRGITLRFVTCQKAVPPGTGREHLYKILDHLALLKESEEIRSPLEESLEGYVVFILSGPGSSLANYSEVASRLYHASEL